MRRVYPDRSCKRIPDPTEADALTHGHWQPRPGGIRVWVDHSCPDCGNYLPPRTRCDTCLTWAVKNARDTEWARISKATRPIIFHILELQHAQNEAA
jgi:hypothetical protein